MKTTHRIFWLLSLMFFAAGCTGFQPACYTGEEGIADSEVSGFKDCHLQGGERVRITTVTGDKIVGHIQRVTPEWLVVAPTDQSEISRLYTPSQILLIEKSTAPGKTPQTVEEPEVGDEVAMILTDRSRFEGRILMVDDSVIVLKHESGPDQRLVFSRDDVATIEYSSSGSSGSSSWVAPVAVLAGVALIVGGIAFANEMSDLAEWGNN